MNEIQIFNFQNSEVRVVNIDNEPWFVGKDVCLTLGYADPTTAIRSHCRGVQKLHPIIDSLGRKQEVRILPESDVMRLICGSTLPEAVAFEKLVFEEILPSIRKHGGYIAANGTETPEELYARALTSLKAALDRQKAITAEQAVQLELQAPDVEYARNVLASDGLHTVNAVAVHLGISADPAEQVPDRRKLDLPAGRRLLSGDPHPGEGILRFSRRALSEQPGREDDPRTPQMDRGRAARHHRAVEQAPSGGIRGRGHDEQMAVGFLGAARGGGVRRGVLAADPMNEVES